MIFKGITITQRIQYNSTAGKTLSLECQGEQTDDHQSTEKAVAEFTLGDDILTLDAKMDTQNTITGQLKVYGSSLLAPNKLVSLKNIGNHYDGDHLISKIHHELRDGNWLTNLSLGTVENKSPLNVDLDDDKKVITVSTSGGNQIVLSDEDEGISLADQNGNKIIMNSSGISLNSPGDISINADGNVSISGTSGVTVTSEAEVSVSAEASMSISALDLSLSGEVALSASSGAETSLSSHGELSINGAMVMIN